MSGRGHVRLAAHARMIALTACAFCQKLGPECQCGYPLWKRTEPRTNPAPNQEAASE